MPVASNNILRPKNELADYLLKCFDEYWFYR